MFHFFLIQATENILIEWEINGYSSAQCTELQNDLTVYAEQCVAYNAPHT